MSILLELGKLKHLYICLNAKENTFLLLLAVYLKIGNYQVKYTL